MGAFPSSQNYHNHPRAQKIEYFVLALFYTFETCLEKRGGEEKLQLLIDTQTSQSVLYAACSEKQVGKLLYDGLKD